MENKNIVSSASLIDYKNFTYFKIHPLFTRSEPSKEPRNIIWKFYPKITPMVSYKYIHQNCHVYITTPNYQPGIGFEGSEPHEQLTGENESIFALDIYNGNKIQQI